MSNWGNGQGYGGHGQQQQGYGPPPGAYGGPAPLMVPTGFGGMAPACKLCGGPTALHSRVSTGGWVVFVVLLIVCFVFCWIGLLMRERGQRCTRCYAMQGGMG